MSEWYGILHTGNDKGDCLGRRGLMKLTWDPIWGSVGRNFLHGDPKGNHRGCYVPRRVCETFPRGLTDRWIKVDF